MIFMGLLFNHILPLFGVFWLITVVWKMARKYPVKRWFF